MGSNSINHNETLIQELEVIRPEGKDQIATRKLKVLKEETGNTETIGCPYKWFDIERSSDLFAWL